MEKKKLKVGITGANGRIGTVLRKNLQDHYELKLFAYNPPDGVVFVSEPIPKELNPIFADFSNSEEVEGKFEGLDVVIHLAALVDVTPYGENWQKMWKNNFDATWSVFRECIRAKVKRIIFASSNHVQNGSTVRDPKKTESIDYSKITSPLKLSKKNQTLNKKKGDPAFPDSMYAVAKLFGEDIGRLAALHDKLEVVCLRIGWLQASWKDDPSDLKGTLSEDYMRSMYLSHRDCVEFFKHAVEVKIKSENGIPFMMAYVCSNNDRKVYDMTESIKNLEYVPQDNSEKFFE